MIEIISTPSHVAAYRFTGQLTAEDYDACIADLEAKLAQYPRIAVVSDLTGLTGLTFEALGKDLRYSLSKLGEYSRFARAAVITDRRWLAGISEAAGRLLPRTEVRTFEAHEQAPALAWAEALDPYGQEQVP